MHSGSNTFVPATAVLSRKTPSGGIGSVSRDPSKRAPRQPFHISKHLLGEDKSMRSAVSFIHPRDEILQAIQRIYRYRMTTTSGGNLSIREDNGDIWITPARLDKGSLRREDIVFVRADGTVEGPHRPSSELPFHQEIYRTRHDIRGIVHAHPVALVAFSLVHLVPDTHLFHQTRLVCGEAGFAPLSYTHLRAHETRHDLVCRLLLEKKKKKKKKE